MKRIRKEHLKVLPEAKRSLLFFLSSMVLVCFNVMVDAAPDTATVTKSTSLPATSLLNKADEAFTGRYYLNAFNLYSTALMADSLNPNLNFKVALCHLYLLHQPRLSAKLLQTSINNFKDKYDFYNDRQKQSSIDAFYFLGKSFMYSGQIDSGIQYLVYYQNLMHNNLPMDVGRQLKMCLNAKQLMKAPRELNVRALSGQINSGYDESHPVLSLDNSVLFFASRRPSKTLADGQLADNDIYYSLADTSGTFGAPLAFPFNTPYDDEPLFLNANGTRLYLRRANKEGSGDIYYSEKSDSGWTEPQKMKGVNSAYDEQGLSISNNGTLLVISSNRPGGLGGYDLYIAEGKNGNWGALKNMGPQVNTDMDEISPFVFPGGKRVYFATNGNTEYGMGGFDIFFTEPDSVGKKWSRPFTMGYPVNTSGNEFGYVLGSQGKTIYTAVGKNGDLDLFDIIAGEYKPDVQEQITDVVASSGETQTVAIVEVDKEKKVEVEKDVEVAKVEEVEKDVDKNVGYVNADEAQKLDKVVAVKQEDVEVQNIVETEKTVYINQSQHVIDSLNNVNTDAKTAEADGTGEESASASGPMRGAAVSGSEGRAIDAAKNGGQENTESQASPVFDSVTTNVANAGDYVSDGKGIDKAAKSDGKNNLTAAGNNGAEREKEAPAGKIMANISKSERDSLVKRIKEDITKSLEEKRRAVFKTFHYNFNNDAVALEGYELKILADFLKEHKDVNIEVVGHTDNRGTWETNFWISRQRAKSVYDYLMEKGISTARIIFNGKGSIEPVADNNTSIGRAKNRRVEIILIE